MQSSDIMQKVYIEKNEDFLRIVMLDKEGDISLFMIDKEDGTPKVGEIYLGMVESIAPRIEAYFINIDKKRNCLLPFSKAHKKLKIGDYVIVEIIKEELEEKCAKVTSKFSIGGEALVITSGKGRVFYSNKIQSKSFKSKTKDLIKEEKLDIVYRKSAENLVEEELINQYKILKESFYNIVNKGEYSSKKGLLYKSYGILKEFLSTLNFEESYEIILNHMEIKEFLETYKSMLGEEYKRKIKIEFLEKKHILDENSVEDKILDLVQNKIYLNKGANIVIDRTEAMTVIDVNSGEEGFNGSIIGKKNINYESAKIIPKEILKRNLSGMIIIDFVNNKNKSEQEKIISILKEGFKNDRNKTFVYDFTELDLIQISRERRGKSVYEYLLQRSNDKFIRYEKLDFNYLLFYIKNKLSILEASKGDHIYIEVPSYYEIEVVRKREYIKEYLNLNSLSIYIDFKRNLDKINIRKIILNKEKAKLEKFKL